MLLEALISILIFSIGILGIVGLQANSIKMSSDAKYRSDASLLANQYLGSMWGAVASGVAAPSVACAASFNVLMPQGLGDFNSNPAGISYTPWLNTVQGTLPNATADVVTNTVLDPAGCVNGELQSTRTDATITITWQLPGGDVHTYTTTTVISAQKDN